MTQPRPSADELLEAVRSFLEEDLLPTLDGRLRFHTRVAVNVLDIVRRELAEGPAADAAERDRLVALLGREGDLDELAAALAHGLRAGEVDPDDPAVVDHLRATAATDVAIANPRHVAPPDA
jgi:hypothetical protein